MRRIFQNRILELGRGEEGVALVVTLAVFMFMYIFCAGVFAVGKMVKDRISLQNAADAAAYSAAVVQADTLSRIATINRAMSWTYAQMNKRRMDFIVYRWMEHAKQHYDDDRTEAATWVENSKQWAPHHLSHTLYHGSMSMSPMMVNNQRLFDRWNDRYAQSLDASNAGAVPYKRIKSDSERIVGNELADYDTAHFWKEIPSCYDTGSQSGIKGIERQIDADMRSIYLMHRYEKYLIEGEPGRVGTRMKDRINAAAVGILRANISEFDDTCAYVVKADSGKGNTGFLCELENTVDYESRFLDWGNRDEQGRVVFQTSNQEVFFDKGAGTWFKPDRSQSGFLWKYTDGLNATWSWNAWRCEGCKYATHTDPITKKTYETCTSGNPVYDTECGHSSCDCCCAGQTRHEVRCLAESSELRKEYGWVLYCKYEHKKHSGDTSGNNSGRVLRAKPFRLKRNFFGSENPYLQNGTITVGVARPDDNPWRSVLGKALSNIGLYHAFDPYLDWMVCFASARAGYKVFDKVPDFENYRYNQKPRVYKDERDYCIDWKETKRVISGWHWVKNRKGHGMHPEPIWDRPDWRQSWNLRQSDWDAVMIPVCRAASGAEERTDHARTYGYFREPCWGATDGNYLENLVKNETWIFPEDRAPNAGAWYAFSAGPDKPLSISDYGYIDYEPGDLGGLLNKLPENYQGWQSNRGLRGRASVIKWPYRWRVSAPGSRLNWVELQKEMLH